MVDADYAEELADALRAAARGEPSTDEPIWLNEFIKEYAEYKTGQQPAMFGDQD